MVAVGMSQPAAIVHRRTALSASYAMGRADRLHAARDAFAREVSWSVRVASGRFGFGARMYRDPRFGRVSVEDADLTELSPRPVPVALRADYAAAWQERSRVEPDFAGQRLARAGRSSDG